jgi:hypothetical protein
MRITQAILVMIALLIIAGQTFRHVYVRWVEPRESVMDQFRDRTEQEIATSKSLDELTALYAEAKKRVDEEEAKRAESDEPESSYERYQREPYKSARQFEDAISEREDHQKQLCELHFFWWCGLASVALGLVAYFKLNAWLGLSLLVLGFCEMIWATAPALRTFDADPEFDRLLTGKVIYSAVSLLLVLFTWLSIARSTVDDRQPR